MTHQDKACSKCGLMKPIDQFYKDKQKADGLTSHCKTCKRVSYEKYFSDPKNKEKAALTAYAYHDNNKDVLNAKDRERYRKNPRKIWKRTQAFRKRRNNVHQRLRLYMQYHNIERPDTCTSCGYVGKLDAHHPDYDKPFDVIWVCHQCHMKNYHRKRVVYAQS